VTTDALLPDTLDILLVEDDPLEAELTLRPLREGAPHRRIGIARDGEEALDYLLGRGRYRHRFGAPMPRLTLLDLKLPKVDGLDVLRAVRGNPRTSAAPVVVFTSGADARDVTQSYQLGANSCVRKPIEFAAFDRMLRSLTHYWLELNEPPSSPARAG
jgi:two-component system response regulator